MKKYTKRLKNDLHHYRIAKNYIAAALPMIAAFKVLALHSSAWPIVTAALLGGMMTIFGETLYYIGMSWVETCESIQENGIRKLPPVDSDFSFPKRVDMQ